MKPIGLKRLRYALKTTSTLAISALPWLRDPWAAPTWISPQVWELLRANPQASLSTDGKFRLVPR